MGVIDLNAWHYAIHRVSGSMAVHFNRATRQDLLQWAEALTKIAKEMAQEANAGSIGG